MTKFLAFGCVHLPIQSEEFRQWRLDKIREVKPDVVINLGDWIDADGASRWENENDWTLQQEYDALGADAKDIRDAAPLARLIWVQGNHDANLEQPGRVDKRLRAACNWRKNTSSAFIANDWKIIPYRHEALYRLGQVTFQHGAQTNVNAERDHSLAYGVPFGLHVSAHTHRPKRITPIELPGRVPVFGMQYCNVGCGADWDQMRYMDRLNKLLWGRAVLVGECNATQRRAWFGSQQWSAELLVHSMASPRAAV